MPSVPRWAPTGSHHHLGHLGEEHDMVVAQREHRATRGRRPAVPILRHLTEAQVDDVCRRIADRIEVQPSGCWHYRGAHSPAGYPMIWVGTAPRKVVRVMAELTWGDLDPDLVVDHRCRDRACINVAEHCEMVTDRENVARGNCPTAINARKSRCPRGHAYDEANTYRAPSRPTWRQCRACIRERQAATR